jgi:hypothetical protein
MHVMSHSYPALRKVKTGTIRVKWMIFCYKITVIYSNNFSVEYIYIPVIVKSLDERFELSLQLS